MIHFIHWGCLTKPAWILSFHSNCFYSNISLELGGLSIQILFQPKRSYWGASQCRPVQKLNEQNKFRGGVGNIGLDELTSLVSLHLIINIPQIVPVLLYLLFISTETEILDHNPITVSNLIQFKLHLWDRNFIK